MVNSARNSLLVLFLASSLYAGTVEISQDILDGSDKISAINENFNALFNGKLDVRPGSIYPKASGKYDLGSLNYKFKSLYLSDILVLPSSTAIRGTITPQAVNQIIGNTSVPGQVCIATGTLTSTWVVLGSTSTVCPN